MINMFTLNFLRHRKMDELVRTFKTDNVSNENLLLKTTIQIGHIRYRHCASITMNHIGFYLQVKFIFKHYPTIFIPWKALAGSKPARLYGRKALELFFVEKNLPSIIFYETDIREKYL